MQSDYWNLVAEKKVFRHPLDLDVFSSFVEHSGFIVDLGCGYGRVLAELKLAGYENLLGLDTSEAMIARAKCENSNLEFRKVEGLHINETANSVDAILLFTVLTSIPRDEDQRLLVNECRRVLRQGGVLYVSDLYQNRDARNQERYDEYENEFGVRGVFRLEDGGVMRHHTEAWISSLLEGYEPLHHTKFSVETMNGNSSNAFQFIGRKPFGP